MPKAKKEKVIFQRKKISLIFKQYKFILIPIFILGLGALVLFFLFPAKKSDNNPVLFHLVASISAQKGPIKINPEFSYQENTLNYQLPRQIIIPSINIDIPIVPAEIIDGYWETASDSASFGLGSAYPGQPGNTVIFGHATNDLFGPLRKLKKKDLIYLLTDNQWFSFRVEEIKIVLPNQVEVVSPTKDKRLTLYTCTGFNDSHRLVLIAKPEKKPLDKDNIYR
jgi:LPXTG-site transpeptidase (sortase) family protein